MASPSSGKVTNMLSVDVEDYFHVSALAAAAPRERWPQFEIRVVRNTRRLLRIFDEHRVRATFFILGWVAERQPALVREIGDAGHEIASHGYWHELVYDLTPGRFREDVRRTKAVLEDTSGHRVDGYRAPSFSITRRSLWALDVLLEEGYRYDASIFPIAHDRYGIPGAPRHRHALARPAGTLLEVPASTARVARLNLPIGGGGYFRLLPFWFTRWGMRRVNRSEGQPFVFYLHPWEIDPEQPRLPASWLNRLRHYHNLAKTEARLRRLLNEFAFGPVADGLKAVSAVGPARVDLPAERPA